MGPRGLHKLTAAFAYASVGADFAPAPLRYARYLGIDPVADHDLLWIAVEAGPKMPS